MIEMRRAQRSFGDGLIAEEVSDLREDWMRHADQVLADEQIVAAVYDALGKRHPKSRRRGRLGVPARMRRPPQGQGWQADRIRQDGEAAGGRKPDRHRLRGL